MKKPSKYDQLLLTICLLSKSVSENSVSMTKTLITGNLLLLLIETKLSAL